MLASAKANNVELVKFYNSSCIVPLAKELLQKMRTLFLLLLLLLLMTMTKEFVSGSL
jgi:hypothetical protein